jgi:hypothetical protein
MYLSFSLTWSLLTVFVSQRNVERESSPKLMRYLWSIRSRRVLCYDLSETSVPYTPELQQVFLIIDADE